MRDGGRGKEIKYTESDTEDILGEIIIAYTLRILIN
jgi:hypothetical protein